MLDRSFHAGALCIVMIQQLIVIAELLRTILPTFYVGSITFCYKLLIENLVA
jgi:hypothetical protein